MSFPTETKLDALFPDAESLWYDTEGRTKTFVPLLAVALLTVSCASQITPTPTSPALATFAPLPTALPTQTPTPTNTPTPTPEPSATPTFEPSETPTPAPTFMPLKWDVYDPNPQHLWNRLFRQLYARTSKDGKEYGRDSLDLLQWDGTTNFFDETSYPKTIQLLDEFLSTNGKKLIADPLKRALFQRDLWTVFDWLASEPDTQLDQRRALESRLARVIQRLALTEQQIESLPDNYRAAVNSGAFPAKYQPDNPDFAYLPVGLFASDSDWINRGREGGPNAIVHVQEIHFLGRSAFLIFIRAPGGRAATVDFARKLETHPYSPFGPDPPVGTEVALARQMMLIDQQGNMVASPIVESIQFRHFYSSDLQYFYEFTLDRDRLFRRDTGGLRPVAYDETSFPLFLFQGVSFFDMSEEIERGKVTGLSECPVCHLHSGLGITTIESYSRSIFPVPELHNQILYQTTPALEAQTTIAWKLKQPTWQALQALWQR